MKRLQPVRGKQGYHRSEHELVLADVNLGDFASDAVKELLEACKQIDNSLAKEPVA